MAGNLVRVDDAVMRYIQRKQKPRETYNEVLRRLLGIDVKEKAS